MPQKRKTNESFEVYSCGSRVALYRPQLTIEQSVEGTIISIRIDFNNIEYLVEWFDKSIRYVEWMNEILICPINQDSKILEIGFHNPVR